MTSTAEPCDQQSHLSSEQFLQAKRQLEKCLAMMKASRNDNEKMASLLLFTHLMKNNDSLAVDSGEVFHAIGAKFIVRLLNSKNVPDGCPRLMYKSLALNILASFTNQDLLFEPLLVANLSIIAEVLALGDGITEVADLHKDGVRIIQIFSRSHDGCKHLLENNCIPVICQAVVNNPEISSLFEILKGILLYLPLETWNLCGRELSNMLNNLSKTFSECQDLEKFSTCDKLVVIIASLCDVEDKETKSSFDGTWMENIQKGLRDILQSRCKIAFKYSALQLAAGMVELYGIEWCLPSAPIPLDLSNTKFWLIILSIAKTEVKMILESGDEREVETKSTVLVACYRIFEKTIEFLITDKTGGWSFSSDLVLQLHAILMESFDCIIKFLIQVGSLAKNHPEEENVCFQRPIVTATVRVLCSWLSEETNSLSDGVSKVLPILIMWARRSLEEGSCTEASANGHELITHLLPPFCHLSADETFCTILIENEAHIMLARFFNQLWLKQENKCQEYPSSLITLCNVFLNFCVLEIDLVKNNKVFQDILNCITASLPKIVGPDSVVLKAHFILLGLLLFRHRRPIRQNDLSAQETSFFKAVIDFLKQAQFSICSDSQEESDLAASLASDWDNISELWFLSVQNLVACAKGMLPVKKVLLMSSWVGETKGWLQICEKNNEKTFADMKSALLPIANLE